MNDDDVMLSITHHSKQTKYLKAPSQTHMVKNGIQVWNSAKKSN